MAKCPFAVWMPLQGSPGRYTGGHPFKIVHHTTEGGTAEGAFAEYRRSRNIPHFTVDDLTIYQHADTGVAVSALKHPAGVSETNRSSAVQIELVGFAGRPKSGGSLRNMARLCRWIEGVHAVPQEWPNGLPKPPKNGGDPGGHNRNEENWNTRGGHYGHSHVPGNLHWDPAYTVEEVQIVMQDVAPEIISSIVDGRDHSIAGHPESGHHTG